jgi:hypothetical protein
MNGNTAASLQPLPIRQTPAAGLVAAPQQSLHLIPALETEPRWIWRVVQWKCTVDATSRWLKRMYFHRVFLPFNRFSYWAFNLVPPNGKDETGHLCWTEDQGCFDTEWEAEQEALKYKFGHAIRVPLRASLPSVSVNTEQVHPHSPRNVRLMYEKKTVDATIDVPKLDLVKLAAKVMSSDRLVEQYQAKIT